MVRAARAVGLDTPPELGQRDEHQPVGQPAGGHVVVERHHRAGDALELERVSFLGVDPALPRVRVEAADRHVEDLRFRRNRRRREDLRDQLEALRQVVALGPQRLVAQRRLDTLVGVAVLGGHEGIGVADHRSTDRVQEVRDGTRLRLATEQVREGVRPIHRVAPERVVARHLEVTRSAPGEYVGLLSPHDASHATRDVDAAYDAIARIELRVEMASPRAVGRQRRTSALPDVTGPEVRAIGPGVADPVDHREVVPLPHGVQLRERGMQPELGIQRQDLVLRNAESARGRRPPGVVVVRLVAFETVGDDRVQPVVPAVETQEHQDAIARSTRAHGPREQALGHGGGGKGRGTRLEEASA